MKISQTLVLILGFVVFANAQTNDKAILSGTVYDENQLVVPGTKIVVKSKDDEEKFQAISNDEGYYQLTFPLDTYRIEILNDFFNPVVCKKFKATKTERIQFDVILKPKPCVDCEGDIYGERKPIKINKIYICPNN